MKMSHPQGLGALTPASKTDENRKILDKFSPVFFIAITAILIIVLLSLFQPDWAKSILIGGRRWSVINLDWLFMLCANSLLLLSLILAISPMGKKRLGDSLPEFSNLSWHAMIITTGLGLTLVFWGVAEPAAFYTDWWGVPLNVEPKTPTAVELSLSASLYHWGLHPGAIYCMTGLAIAYACYNKGLPLKISSIFHPILKQQTQKVSGKVIDSLAVIATVFGIATTMGLGARQAAKALEYLYGIPNTLMSQSALIIFTSVVLVIVMQKGLNKGIKRFSLLNISAALIFAFALMLLNDPISTFAVVVNTPITYIENLVAFSQWSDRTDLKFFHGWTIFYWIWWFSWAPFIGMFMARISKGRSIRECVFAVVLMPTLFLVLWFGVLGGIGLEQITQNVGTILEPRLSPSTALFKMLEILPLSQWLSLVAIVLVLLCFVSTSDSSIYVIEMLTRKNADASASKGLTQFWVLIQGSVALCLLVFGGKKALESVQSASLLIGVLMCLLLFIASVCFVYSLKQQDVS